MREAIVRPLLAFNNSRASQPEDYRSLVIVLSDADTGGILGGLWGETNFAYLHVDLLFVPETLRGKGLGRQMMLEAEEVAKARRCGGAWLDTCSFQARGFYERLGFSVFGTIDDFPPGQKRFFMKKSFG
jgi:GNAT superfamily N-acetyltransferase